MTANTRLWFVTLIVVVSLPVGAAELLYTFEDGVNWVWSDVAAPSGVGGTARFRVEPTGGNPGGVLRLTSQNLDDNNGASLCDYVWAMQFCHQPGTAVRLRFDYNVTQQDSTGFSYIGIRYFDGYINASKFSRINLGEEFPDYLVFHNTGTENVWRTIDHTTPVLNNGVLTLGIWFQDFQQSNPNFMTLLLDNLRVEFVPSGTWADPGFDWNGSGGGKYTEWRFNTDGKHVRWADFIETMLYIDFMGRTVPFTLTHWEHNATKEPGDFAINHQHRTFHLNTGQSVIHIESNYAHSAATLCGVFQTASYAALGAGPTDGVHARVIAECIIDDPSERAMTRLFLGVDPYGRVNPKYATWHNPEGSWDNWSSNGHQWITPSLWWDRPAGAEAFTVFLRFMDGGWSDDGDGKSASAHMYANTVLVQATVVPGGPTPTPTFADTDDDGVPDEAEGWPPAAGQSNRYLRDSDGDGLDDGTEDANANGARDAGETNTRHRDSDGDGAWDGIEVLILGTDPLDGEEPASFVDQDGDGLPVPQDSADYNPDTDVDGYADGYEAAMLGLAAVQNAEVVPALGDLNKDGAASNLDALAAQMLFLDNLGPTSPVFGGDGFVNADPSRDGFVSNIDALAIQSFFLGNLALLPI